MTTKETFLEQLYENKAFKEAMSSIPEKEKKKTEEEILKLFSLFQKTVTDPLVSSGILEKSKE